MKKINVNENIKAKKTNNEICVIMKKNMKMKKPSMKRNV